MIPNNGKIISWKNLSNKNLGCRGRPILGLDVWEHAYYLGH